MQITTNAIDGSITRRFDAEEVEAREKHLALLAAGWTQAESVAQVAAVHPTLDPAFIAYLGSERFR